VFKDQDGKTAFEKEVEYFLALVCKRYPDLNVIYEGKPLIADFLWARRRIQTQPIILSGSRSRQFLQTPS